MYLSLTLSSSTPEAEVATVAIHWSRRSYGGWKASRQGVDGRVSALADDGTGHRVVKADPEVADGAPAACLGVDKVDNGDAFMDVAPPVGEHAAAHGLA